MNFEFTKEMENILTTCSQMSEQHFNDFLSQFNEEQQETIRKAVFSFKMAADKNFYKAVEESVAAMVWNTCNPNV